MIKSCKKGVGESLQRSWQSTALFMVLEKVPSHIFTPNQGGSTAKKANRAQQSIQAQTRES